MDIVSPLSVHASHPYAAKMVSARSFEKIIGFIFYTKVYNHKM